MFKYPLLIVACLMAAIATHAQDSLRVAKPTGDSLIRTAVIPYVKYSTIVYSVDGYALSRKEIKNRIKSYEPSALEFQKYQSSNAGAILLTCVAVTAGGIASNQNRQGNSGAVGVWAGVGIGGLIGEIICLGGRNRHWNKAIEVYNRQFSR